MLTSDPPAPAPPSADVHCTVPSHGAQPVLPPQSWAGWSTRYHHHRRRSPIATERRPSQPNQEKAKVVPPRPPSKPPIVSQLLPLLRPGLPDGISTARPPHIARTPSSPPPPPTLSQACKGQQQRQGQRPRSCSHGGCRRLRQVSHRLSSFRFWPCPCRCCPTRAPICPPVILISTPFFFFLFLKATQSTQAQGQQQRQGERSRFRRRSRFRQRCPTFRFRQQCPTFFSSRRRCPPFRQVSHGPSLAPPSPGSSPSPPFPPCFRCTSVASHTRI